MSDFTQNQEIWQWLDAHWDQFADYWHAKMKDASQVELIGFDSDKVQGVLASFNWQGVSKVVKVTPQSLLQALSQLNEELRQRCIEGAEAAETAATYATGQGDYAKGQGDRVVQLIEEITALKALVKSQGDTAQAQGAAADELRQTVNAWYSPFKAVAEAWYADISSAVSSWFSGVQSAWTEWFNARKAEWNAWYGDTSSVWSSWFDTVRSWWTAFSGNVTDTWEDMTFMFSDAEWNANTIYLRNKATKDSQGNWWVSLKSTADAPNINHPLPGFDSNGDPNPSEWWRLWIDWQHPLARVLAAVANADSSAANADAKALLAQEAADRANGIDVVDHENRITVIEDAMEELTTEDIVEIQNAIASLEGLIGSDVDGSINKFNEIVAFLDGIDDDSELTGILSDIASQLAAKQPVGDYATNSRVNALEAKVNTWVSPRFVGDVLVFPAESNAHFEDDVLILTQ